MSTKRTPPIRVRQPRTWGEFWQAMAYGALGTWSVIFWFYPPAAFVTALDSTTRIFWLLSVVVGAVTAITGLITRLDLKVELPGIIFMMYGPLAYAMSQIYYVLYPPLPPSGYAPPRPQDRYALIVYASIPAFFLMVRFWQLVNQARLAKQARQASSDAARQLMETGVGQVATGPLTIVTTTKRPAHDVLRDAENTLLGGEDR